MSAAVLLGGGELLTAEAAVSAILLVVAGPGRERRASRSTASSRALIGGGVALAVTLAVLPARPGAARRAAPRRRCSPASARRWSGSRGAAARDAAARPARRSARRARSTRWSHEFDEALRTGRETARLSPRRRGGRWPSSTATARASRRSTSRSATRACSRATRCGCCAPGEPVARALPEAVRELGLAVWALAGAYDQPERADAVRGHALRAGALAGEAQAARRARSRRRSARPPSTCAARPICSRDDARTEELEAPTEELLAAAPRDGRRRRGRCPHLRASPVARVRRSRGPAAALSSGAGVVRTGYRRVHLLGKFGALAVPLLVPARADWSGDGPGDVLAVNSDGRSCYTAATAPAAGDRTCRSDRQRLGRVHRAAGARRLQRGRQARHARPRQRRAAADVPRQRRRRLAPARASRRQRLGQPSRRCSRPATSAATASPTSSPATPTARCFMYRGDGDGGWVTGAAARRSAAAGARSGASSPAATSAATASPTSSPSTPDGALLMYRGNGAGGWVTGTGEPVGSGWAAFTALAGGGDFSGDGKADVLARRPDGELLPLPRQRRRRLGHRPAASRSAAAGTGSAA